MLRNIKGWAAAVAAAALLGACGVNQVTDDPAASVSPAVYTVAGYITEIEDGKMSLRSFDNLKQLIISLEDPPVPVETLRQKMDGRQPVSVTYRVETGRLVPLEISDAPVTPLSPTPGPTYDASY